MSAPQFGKRHRQLRPTMTSDTITWTEKGKVCEVAATAGGSIFMQVLQNDENDWIASIVLTLNKFGTKIDAKQFAEVIAASLPKFVKDVETELVNWSKKDVVLDNGSDSKAE